MRKEQKSRDEILNFLREHKPELNKRYGVRTIGLFGSYARGDARGDSDIDIIVELTTDHIADNYFGLLHFLEDSLHKKIDLGLASSIKPAFKPYILNEVVYA